MCFLTSSFVNAIALPYSVYLQIIRTNSLRVLLRLVLDHSRQGWSTSEVFPFRQSRHQSFFRQPANSVIWKCWKPNSLDAARQAASNFRHFLTVDTQKAATTI